MVALEVSVVTDLPDGQRLAEVRDRLYGGYATTHAGTGNPAATAAAFRRDIAPHLPADREARIVDVGCGQGHLIRTIQEAGYRRVEGIDISPEQVELAHRAGSTQVRQGDFLEILADTTPVDAIVATDLLEHLTKEEVLTALDAFRGALRGTGALVMRVPNAASPFGGAINHGDFTHETEFTARSIAQALRAVGFAEVAVTPVAPAPGGLRGTVRWAVWTVVAAAMRVAFAAETGRRHDVILTQNMMVVAR